jgi:hypothetical protein
MHVPAERRGRVRDLDRTGLTARGGPSAAGVLGDTDRVRLLRVFGAPNSMEWMTPVQNSHVAGARGSGM